MKLTRFACAALCACLVIVAAGSAARAQTDATDPDSVAVAAPASAAPTQSSKPPLRDRIYWGGSVVFSIGGDVSTIGVYPMVAYKLRPKWSVGLEAGYEHVSYDDFDVSADNYGGSIFTRYRLIPRMYLHAEYQMINYEMFTSSNVGGFQTITSERDWVPFLLLGGGLSTMMGANTWAYVEVLFDVLRDNNSPYDDWEPFVSVGVGVGF